MPQLHINNNHTLYTLTGSSLFLTSGFLILSFLCPFAVDNSYATTETAQNGDYYIETTTTDLNLSIHTTPAGAQETASHDVIVKTDDPAGFTLTVSVNNDTSNSLNLNGNTSATSNFPATSGTYANPTALDDNSWGFTDTLTKKDNDQWSAVPLLSNAQQIKQTGSANTSGDTTTIYYAINAKYDGKHENGSYSNTITYSVVGNTVPDFCETHECMQDKTYTNWCTNLTPTTSTSNAYTYELYDKRTEEPYYIRKFTYSSKTYCMMVENLYLTGGTKLTNMDSNISNTYTLPESSAFNSENGMNDGGRYRYGFEQPTSKGTTIADGSYFSWGVAKAEDVSGADLDICPKNWRLFRSAERDTIKSMVDGKINIFFSNSLGDINDPILSGLYGDSNGNYDLNQVGEYGYWWSGTQSGSRGYYLGTRSGSTSLYAYSSGITPYSYRYGSKTQGLSVRCLLSSE